MATGIGARVQGMQRYYALLLSSDDTGATNTTKLVKALDGETVLAETAFPWRYGRTYVLSLSVVGA